MLNKFDKILMVGLLASGLTYLTADGVANKIREPMSPPAAYQKISAGQYKHHSGENVEISATPVFVHSRYGGLEIGLREGDELLQAVANGISPSMFSFRPPNSISQERVKEVFSILKEKILAGDIKPISLRGTLDGEVLKSYSLNIGGIDYYLLQH